LNVQAALDPRGIVGQPVRKRTTADWQPIVCWGWFGAWRAVALSAEPAIDSQHIGLSDGVNIQRSSIAGRDWIGPLGVHDALQIDGPE
jgi:hypothetical protein